MQPTALAPTVELAEPKVRKFALRLLEELDPAELGDFYSCEPSTCDVKDSEGNEGVEGLWGVELLVQSFSWENVAARIIHELGDLGRMS